MAKRVLIIDDDSLLARLMVRVLDYPELHVVSVGSLAEARTQIARAGLPDVIVADIHLPNGDGRHLREEFAAVPFVIISGFPQEEPDLAKPFTSHQLRDAIAARLHLTLGVP